MKTDLEIEAMSKLANALESLDSETAKRVVRWAAERYGIVQSLNRFPAFSTDERAPGKEDSGVSGFADLFNDASPTTTPEKALIAAYWLQVAQKREALDAQEVNALLKNLGHRVSNITDAFSGLIDQRPRLAIQVRKMGSGKQARKKYKLTVEGIRKVDSMLRNGRQKQIGDEDGQS